MGQQLVGAFLLHCILHTVGSADTLHETGELVGIGSAARHTAIHRFPWSPRSLVGQAQHIIPQHRLARIAHPQEIATIARRSHAGRTLNHQLNEFAAVVRALQTRQCLHIHRQFADALAQTI